MSKKTIKVYKGIPVRISGTQLGCYNYSKILTFQESGSKYISFQQYDGLKTTSYRQLTGPIVLDFSTTRLPDYTESKALKMCFADYTQSYKGITIQKEDPNTEFSHVRVSVDNILSGFGTGADYSMYAKILKTFPSALDQFKLLFKITLGSAYGRRENMLVADTSSYKGVFISTAGAFGCRTASNEYNAGSSVLNLKGTYWIKVVREGENYVGYHKADADYTLENVEADENWIQDWSTTSEIFAGHQLYLGFDPKVVTGYFRGSMDLNNCSIWCNDELYWHYEIIPEEVSGEIPGCLFEHTDDGKIGSLYCLYDKVNERYYLGHTQTMENCQYLGQVDFLAHDLWTYDDGNWIKSES